MQDNEVLYLFVFIPLGMGHVWSKVDLGTPLNKMGRWHVWKLQTFKQPWHTYLKELIAWQSGWFCHPNWICSTGENIFQIKMTHSQKYLVGIPANDAGDQAAFRKWKDPLRWSSCCSGSSKYPFPQANGRCVKGVGMLSSTQRHCKDRPWNIFKPVVIAL